MSVYWGQDEETFQLVQYCNARIVNPERLFLSEAKLHRASLLEKYRVSLLVDFFTTGVLSSFSADASIDGCSEFSEGAVVTMLL